MVKNEEEDKQVCLDAMNLMWRQGVYNPKDAVTALNFTEFVKRAFTPTNKKSEDGK